jgi:hypothetical protein
LPEKAPFDQADYATEGLGAFLERVLNQYGGRKRTGSYQESSGTITQKPTFCEKALAHIRFEELSDDAMAVVKQIYDFIAKQNSK